MTATYRYTILLLIGFFLHACTSINLARVQNDLDKTIEEHVINKSKFNNNTGDLETSDFKDLVSIFGSIGQEAYKGSQKSGLDRRTKISFLRVAAMAAWQGGETLETEFKTYQGEGTDQCNKMESASAPTRDCTILAILHPLFYADKVATLVTQANLKTSSSKPLSEEEWNQFKKLVQKPKPGSNTSQFRVSTTQNFIGNCKKLFTKYGRLAPSVQKYIKKQFGKFKENAGVLKNAVNQAFLNESESNKGKYQEIVTLAVDNKNQMDSDKLPTDCFK